MLIWRRKDYRNYFLIVFKSAKGDIAAILFRVLLYRIEHSMVH